MIVRIIAVLMLALAISPARAERAYKIYDTHSKKEVDLNSMVQSSLASDIMFFGEFHDDELNHKLQSDYLSAAYAINKSIVVSMEMFERDAQKACDDYFAGTINEEEFIKKSGPWPDYKKFYKPLLEMARENKTYIIASNVPRKYAALIISSGLSGIKALKPEERAMVAREVNINKGPYMDNFYKTMLANVGKDPNTRLDTLGANYQNTLYLYFAAQLIKDETMAESIADYYNKNKTKIVHFDGDFHSNAWLGTVEKLKDRLPKARIITISPQYAPKDSLFWRDDYSKEADYVIVMEQKPPQKFDMAMMGHGVSIDNNCVQHIINIELDIEDHYIKGRDTIKFKNPIALKGTLKLDGALKVKSVKSPNGSLDYDTEKKDGETEITITPDGCELSQVVVEYKGEIYNQAEARNLNQKHAYSRGMISAAAGEGIYLPAGAFYPYTDNDFAEFKVEVTFPDSLEVVTSGKLTKLTAEKGMKHYRFDTELNAEGLTLVGGKYNIADTIYNNVKLACYVMDKNVPSQAYIKALIEYYDYYTKLFGAYPFSNFTIVGNFFDTGFGMPGYTLLAETLMKMPWITLNPGSLAHEFVHNWWGNGVYVSPVSGNWCEALTTFSTNYYYYILTKNKEKSLDWRKKALLSMETLPEDKNYILNDFKSQKIEEDAVIGYQKGAFTFLEVWKALGDSTFFKALKNFATNNKGKKASWNTLINEFKKAGTADKVNATPDMIVNQWLKKKEIPRLSLEVLPSESSATITVRQDLYNLLMVPVKIVTEKDSSIQMVKLKSSSGTIEVPLSGKLKSVQLDPEFFSLRHLYKWEIPYNMKQSFNEKPIVVMPEKSSKEYAEAQKFVEALRGSGIELNPIEATAVKAEELKDKSYIVLGNEGSNATMKGLLGNTQANIKFDGTSVSVDGKKCTLDGNVMIMSFANPQNADKTVSLMWYKIKDDSLDYRRLAHYFGNSYTVLSKTKMGRPLAQTEIYPSKPENNPIEWIAK